MLAVLRVRQLAIIDELEVELGPGLNVVTGETGAGKSILVSALQLVLGARGRPELVRSGAARAEVEALFELDERDRERLLRVGLEAGEELAIRRVVEAEGRTRAWVDGSLATATQLGRITAGLVDISSQHEHHSLVDAATHLGYLDAYAGLRVEAGALAGAWARWKAVADEHRRLEAAMRDGRGDLVRYQLAELDRAGVGPEVEAEVGRLRHAVKLAEWTGRAEEALYSGDEAAIALIARAVDQVELAEAVDPALRPVREQLQAALAEVEDAGRSLGKYTRGVRADPERLTELEGRLSEARRLRRKHGEDLAAARDRLQAEHAELERGMERLAELEEAEGRARGALEEAAMALSARRRAEAERLGAAITGELASLGMGEATVRVGVDDAGISASGVDAVEFLIATNRGEPPRALRRVASGGELSRALLAIKRVLAQVGPVGLYVFDEVDTGVGGAVAEAIGQKLREVARHHQVLCITHLPQIAAQGAVHFHVRKEVVGERTRSSITRLGEEERVEELARMLGGARVTTAQRTAARELLG